MPMTEIHGPAQIMENGDAKEAVNDAKGYALSGKIMLIAIVILFVVIIIMLCLHVYARWYLQRARRYRNLRRTTRRRQQFVFYVDLAAPTALTMASRGLHASVIASLPIFTFSHKSHPEPLDCPVCLSELQEGETGRVLPRCNHSFHIDCIDMWLHSHSTCPLCRSPVDPPPDVVVSVCDTEPASSSGFCGECRFGGEEVNRTGPVVSSSSSSNGLTVEVPGQNVRVGDVSGCDSPTPSFLSPMSRILSFKRILSRERKASVSPTAGCAVGCTSMAELDVERGGREETQ